MSKSDAQMLTESEEILLSRYFDGECGFWARRRAERLVHSSSAAQEFLRILSSTSQEVRVYTETTLVQTNLWSRVESRIESEERASFYLGERRAAPETESLFSRLRSRQAVFGTLSGAAIAATVLILVVRPSDRTNPIPVSLFPEGYHQNAVGALDPRPVAFSQSSPSTMEVDWVRSNNGSFKLIQNPHGKSATIWVSRRPQRALTPKALGAAPATPGFDVTPYLGIDGQRLELSK